MERDDIIEYSLDIHHSEEHGKAIRTTIKWFFIGLTLIKAAYIVLIFMHLGDEKKSLKYMILVPYFIFILYLIYILIVEALAVNLAWTLNVV